MLTAQGNAGRRTARYLDVVDEAWERRNAADEKGGDCPPIAGVSGGVAVDAMEVVHVGDGHVTASDNVVAAGVDRPFSENERGRGRGM